MLMPKSPTAPQPTPPSDMVGRTGYISPGAVTSKQPTPPKGDRSMFISGQPAMKKLPDPGAFSNRG